MMQWKSKSMITNILLLKFLNNQDYYCYNAFELIYNIINFWKQHKQYTTLFYDVNFRKSNIIFDMLILTNKKITVHSTTFNWRFEININKFRMLKSEEFVKNLQKQVAFYVLIIADIITLLKK